MMNILFNLKNNRYHHRVMILDYLRKEMSTGKYYGGRYSNSMDNINEYFKIEHNRLQSWILIPQDLFDIFITKTFKARDGSIINISLGRTIYIQDMRDLNNPAYYTLSAKNRTMNISTDFKIDYSNLKSKVYKIKKAKSIGGFVKITNSDEPDVFDFSPIDMMADNNQNI